MDETSSVPEIISDPPAKPDHTALSWDVQKEMLQAYADALVKDAESKGFGIEGTLLIRGSNDPATQVPVITLGIGSNPTALLVRLAAQSAGDVDNLFDRIMRTPKTHIGLSQMPSQWVQRIRRMFSV